MPVAGDRVRLSAVIVADGFVEHVERGATGSGALDGVRLAVKEIVGLDGVVTTANTPLELARDVAGPGPDASIVARLRAAGARVVGTTVSHELAWGITTHGRGRRVVNPVVDGRVAGGSSGGSAVAVAQGTADLAVGTDTAGSCRIPAAWSGVFGWKSTRDLLPLDRVVPLAPGFDHLGLLAAHPERLRVAVAVLGGGRSEVDRVEVVPPGVPVDEASLVAVEEARRQLGGLGYEVVDGRGPVAGIEVPDPVATFTVLQGAAALDAHRDVLETWPAQRDRYDPMIVARLDAAERRDVDEIAAARREVDSITADALRRTHRTVLLSVATGCTPPTVDDPDHAAVGGGTHALRAVVLPHTVVANLAGVPAVVVPWWVRGEPVGIQLTGSPGTDLSLVELAAALAPGRPPGP